MRKDLMVLGECYANSCVAEMIIDILKLNTRVRHKYVSGRDRILKEITSLYEKSRGDVNILALIDYERGVMRSFIDKNFRFEMTLFDNTLHIGVYKRSQKIIAIIFDPFVEEFLCRSINKFCDDNERKDIKRGDIENVCSRIQTRLLAEKINVLAEKLLEIIKRSIDQTD